MALKNIIGLDHAVILTRDLDAAAENYRRLGFAVSPRGTHSEKLGTGNYTIMLDHDYIELIGVLQPTPHNAPSRALLERRGEGIERTAFTAVDSAAGVEEIRARGLAGIGPIDFERPVTLPDGRKTEAKFRVFQWPIEEAPGGLRIFACQHFTRDAVWVPQWQNHANSARRIASVEILSANPKADAEHMRRLIDQSAQAEKDDIFVVPSGGDRANFVFLTREAFERRHAGVPLDGLPASGGAALMLIADDLDAAARAIGPQAVTTGNAVYAPPAIANGVLVGFTR